MSESGTEGSLRPRYYYNKGGKKEVNETWLYTPPQLL